MPALAFFLLAPIIFLVPTIKLFTCSKMRPVKLNIDGNCIITVELGYIEHGIQRTSAISNGFSFPFDLSWFNSRSDFYNEPQLYRSDFCFPLVFNIARADCTY